jgi:hypothetical protein
MLRRAATRALLAPLPIAVAFVFARVLLGGSLLASLPYVSDEIAYWTQIAAFDVAGFRGGYTTVDEQPARAAFSHFGPQGPAFAVLYGSIARLTGWEYHSAPIFSAVAVMLGAAAWLVLARPGRVRAALLLATFWPIVLAAPNTMQEPLHFAIGATLAALVSVALADEGSSRRWAGLACAVIAAAALLRPTWALVAVGLGWQLARQRGSRSGVWGLAIGLAAAASLYLLFTVVAAPYRGNTLGLNLFGRGVVSGALVLLRGVADARPWLFGEAEPLERFYRFELVVVAFLTALSAVRGRDAATRRIMTVMTVTLWITIVANLALRNVGSWQDYRASAPALLMAVLAAAAARQRWSWGVNAAHIAITPLAIATFKDFHAPRWERESPVTAIQRFAGSVRGQLRYDPSLSGWGNTLLIGVDRYDYPLMGVPRGFGLSVTFDWKDLPMPPKSRYLLLAEPDVATVAPRARLHRLADTPLGALYENQEWRR